jgi:iron complex outermembrane receptor protein
LLTNYAGGDFYDSQGYNDGQIPLEIFGLTATFTKEFGTATFKSISSYSTTDYTSLTVSGTPYQFLEVPSFSLHSKQYSQEFQLLGASADTRFNWVAGIYYYGQTGAERNQLVNFPPLGTPLGRDRRDGPQIDNASYAAYVQATYEIVDNLKVTAGIRYTKDTRETTYHSAIEVTSTKEFVNCTLGIMPTPTTADGCQITYKGKYDYLPWTFGLDYKPSRDVLLYAKISQGYRSGAASSSGPSATNIAVFGLVEPESLISPEVGAKIGLFNNRLQLNSAIFYSKYKNIQQNQVQTAPTGQVSVLRNVGVADIWGGEFSANTRIKKLDLRFSLAVVKPKYTSGPSVGQPFLNTNKYSWSIGGEYPIDTSVGTLRIGGDYSWRSRLWFFPPVNGNARQNADVSQGPLGLTNAHIAFDLRSKPLTINLWAQNLFAKKFQAAALDLVPAGLGSTLVFAGQPRTYGVTASYKFGPN